MKKAANLGPAASFIGLWLLRITAVLLLAGTLASHSRFEQWWIRIWDFPRLQILIALVLVTIIVAAVDRKTRPYLPMALLACAAWQVYRVYPHTFLAPVEVVAAAPDQPAEACLSVMSFNVLQSNRDYAKTRKMIEEVNADVVLLLETDQRWQSAMGPVLRRYPHRLDHPIGNTYGIMFASKLPMSESSIQNLAEPATPSVFTTLQVGGREVRVFGIHPRPPHPGQDTDERDFELVKVGQLAAKENRPVLVVGDFNDVAWSNTSELFKKTGKLLDPRIGRGSFATFPSNMIWLAWPLDHLFVSDHFVLKDIRVLSDVGSDHRAIVSKICLNPKRGELLNEDTEALDRTDRKETREIIGDFQEDKRDAITAD